MKVISNKENKELSFDFEGNTYHFPIKGLIQVEDDLYNHLKELVPLAFNFAPDVKKTDVAVKVKKSETKTIFKGVSFGKPAVKTGNSDGLPSGMDGDGVAWYGEGLTDDSV